MLLMRGLGRPFETHNQLGTIVTATGSTLHRDFGFATAFILYPVLGLAAAAYALYGPRSRWAPALAVLGVVATLLTLLRSETYGLLLGAVALVIAAPPGLVGARSVWRGGQMVAALVGLFVVVAAFNPALGSGIVERSLPGAKESSLAVNNADFRQQALDAGAQVANANPWGLGDIPDDQLEISGITPEYTAHSGLAWVLAYNGWPGLLGAALAYFAMLGASFATRRSAGWLHPAFVAVWLMLGAYSWGASGLAYQEWVVATAAVALAVRFVLPRVYPQGLGRTA
jgi:hypothetical protein